MKLVDGRSDALGLVIAVAICLAASALGGLFTASGVGSWYTELTKPVATPPSWVFAPVWTFLYVTMAVAAWLVWRRRDPRDRGALAIFAAQLALNVVWSGLFFGLHSPLAALVDIVALWIAIAATAAFFARRSRVAAALLLPYLGWVGFATYLNAGLWWLN